MTAASSKCRICGSTVIPLNVREMLYGTREMFVYLECEGCGCVQIADVPMDLGRYYPPDYYSFRQSRRSQLKELAFRAAVFASGHSFARGLRRLQGANVVLAALYRDLAPDWNAKILDVGCGEGAWIKRLSSVGYRNVLGVDPFVSDDIAEGGRTIVRKTDIFGMSGRFDLISFNHSFEHMADQREVLIRARDLLEPGGRILVRLPIVGGEAWRIYRENWVQLDAPRHLYLHSPESLKLLAAQAGLRLSGMTYDSWSFQFWGSEMYARDIPFEGAALPFDAAQMRAFEDRARAANRWCRGDQVAAVLVREA